jgi:hypothetical protein
VLEVLRGEVGLVAAAAVVVVVVAVVALVVEDEGLVADVVADIGGVFCSRSVCDLRRIRLLKRVKDFNGLDLVLLMLVVDGGEFAVVLGEWLASCE